MNLNNSVDFEITPEQVEKAICEKSLSWFAKRAWHVLEPATPLMWGWALDAICDHLEAVSRGEIKRLLMNVPPGSMKSLLTSVILPAWEWGPRARPQMRYLGTAHKQDLAVRDNMKCRRLIQSEWYQSHWPITLTGDQNAKTKFENEQTGFREAMAFASMTGSRGDRIILDDPHSVDDANSSKKLETDVMTFREALPSRVNNSESAIIIIMQRLHEMDVSAVALELGYDHLCIPMRYEGKRIISTALGTEDPRTKEGELMFPERFPEKQVEELENSLGVYATAGQLQQRPSPRGGGILKPDDFRLWPNTKALPPFEYILQSYDTAFTASTNNDPTACSVWGLFYWSGVYNVMLIDAWHEHLEYPDLRARVIKEWSAKYAGDKSDPTNKPRSPDLCLIEKKGSGQSLLQDLAQARVVVAEYNPGNADKVSRAHMVTPLLDAGLVWVPEGKRGDTWPTWADAMMRQLARFPNDEHDDYVDTMSQALRYIRDAGYLSLSRSNRYDDDARPPAAVVVNPYAQ